MTKQAYIDEFGSKLNTLEAVFEFGCNIKLSEDESLIFFLMPIEMCN
jgi:hypothetical protein